MLKINLSDSEGNEKESRKEEETLVQQTDEPSTETVSEELVEEPVEGKKKKGIPSPLLIILLFIVAIALVVYFQREKILSLLPKKAEKVEPVPAPSPSPELEVAPKEPDPTFIAMNKISEIVPQRVWLSSAIINYDGSYEIKGIAFSYSAAVSMGDMLGGIGNVTAKDIPKESKSSETVYNFSASGTISGMTVPEILDTIPTDDLVALFEPVVNRGKEFGVIFRRLPESGQSYSNKDLPFTLEGSYEGLKKVIAELCPEDGDIRVYRIVILPANAGKFFDKVKASFSLRTVSSI